MFKKMNKTKNNVIVSFVFIILFIVMSIFGGSHLQASMSKGEFGSLSSGKYFMVYSNIRNYDAYGIVFDENGKQLEKVFLAQGMLDKGYLSKFGENMLLSNPEQKNSTLITKAGGIETFDMDQSPLLETSKSKYTLVFGEYAILVTNNIEKDFYSEEPLEKEDLKISIQKGVDGESREYTVEGQWIDNSFIYENTLYVIVGKNLKGNEFTIEGYDLNTGEKVKDASIPIMGKNDPSPKRLGIKGNTLVLVYDNEGEDAVLFFDLTTLTEIKKEFIPPAESLISLTADEAGFHLSTQKPTNDALITGNYYLFNDALELVKIIDIIPNTVEKKEYELKDILVKEGKLYAFHQVYETKTENEKDRENFFNEMFIIIGSILGAYEGPDNKSIVCVYDIDTGEQIEKTTLEINDSRLQNGVMIPFLLENNKESNKW